MEAWKHGSFYTGITWNLEKRLAEHNSGMSLSTKGKLPVKLVYTEKFVDKFEAAKREKEIKGWTRLKNRNWSIVYTESSKAGRSAGVTQW